MPVRDGGEGEAGLGIDSSSVCYKIWSSYNKCLRRKTEMLKDQIYQVK